MFWQANQQASFHFKSATQVGILVFFLDPLSATLLKFSCWNITSRRRETDVKQPNLHPHLIDWFQSQLVMNCPRFPHSFSNRWAVVIACFKWRDGPCRFAMCLCVINGSHIDSPSLLFKFAVCVQLKFDRCKRVPDEKVWCWN